MTEFARLPRVHRDHPGGGRGPDRPAEGEADRVARRALRSSAPLSRLPGGEVPAEAWHGRMPGTGHPLDSTERLFFERRFGTDLGRVRVHDDATAGRAAEGMRARGYTVGEHVVLGEDADREVLAHELVHVLQQRRAGHTALQRQARPGARPEPLGPPAAPFDVVRTRPPTEDAKVLFRQDSTSFSSFDLETLRPTIQGGRPLAADVDGYASQEGDFEHNVHLSAHRAFVVAAALTTLLPPGSVVRLHAHGATSEFGDDPGPNRRVGIRLAELREPAAPPTAAPPVGPIPKLELHIDPRRTPVGPGTVPDLPDLRLRRPEPFHGEPYRRDPHGLVPPLSPPGPGGILPPGVFAPPQAHPPLVDWPGLRKTFVEHGAGGIDTRDAVTAELFTRLWYQRYRDLGIPAETARQLANLGTRFLFAGELRKEGDTLADRVENELRRQGVSSATLPLDILDLLRRLREQK